MKATVYCIASQKGGVGKTQTAGSLAAALTAQGRKCLAVDMDSQGNLSDLLNGDRTQPGVYEVLRGEIRPADAIQRTEQADLMAGSKALAYLDKPGTWSELLKDLKTKYDYIVLDTGPRLDTLQLYALDHADRVIIPVQAGAGSLAGLLDMAQTIAKVQQGGTLKVAGVLFTATNTRKTNAEKAMAEAIKRTCKSLGLPVLNTEIRRADAVKAAECFRQAVTTYDPKSKPAQDYYNLIAELKL